MNIPKQINHDTNNFPSFIINEDGISVGTIHAHYSNPKIKQEIIDRYNNYQRIKAVAISMTGLSILLLIALSCSKCPN